MPASGVVFNGNFIKALKQNLNLNDSVYIISGSTDPSSVATSAPTGSLYLNNSNGFLYRKTDNGLSTNWSAFASTTSTGALTSTDWNTFNNKQPALGFTPENTANKGTANGYAPLDGSAKVPYANLPSALMTFKGSWDASTNSPTLADGTGTTGDTYRASVAGTQNLGSGSQTWAVGDFAIYNGTIWQHSPAADGVSSVNGMSGAVTLTQGNLTDVGTDGITVTNGTNAVWGSGTSLSQHVADTTHNGYLSSADWNTFNSKQATVSVGSLDAQSANSNGLAFVSNVLSQQSATASFPGVVNNAAQTFSGTKTFSQIIDSGLTASTAVYANSSQQLTSSTTTDVELSYLTGVIAPIQIQLANKLDVNPGDIPDTLFLASNNTSSATNITGLLFANSTVRAFDAMVSVYVNATSSLYEYFKLQGIQKGSSWEMSQTSVGDNSGFTFTITTAGQVQYTNNNYSGFVNAPVHFRAFTVTV